MKKIKVGVFTSTRADFGLLKPLIDRLEQDKDFFMKVFATGTHLSKEYGYTYKNIEEQGYNNVSKIDMELGGSNNTEVCRSLGNAVIRFTEKLSNENLDVMIILGDRYEAFAMAAVCYTMRIPIAHIHGGEVTEGALDDAYRHSISKMSMIHFSSCEEHRKRILQLGEEEHRVFNVGALGIENILKVDKMSRNELEESLQFDLGKRFAVATCHPETFGIEEDAYVDELLKALKDFQDLKVIFTGSNMDSGGEKINNRIKDEVAKNTDRYIYVESLGLKRYLSAVKACDFVVGNSSSGIIEVPSLKIPVINIGDRQKGRKRGYGIMDVPWSEKEIKKAICRVLNEEIFKEEQEYPQIFGLGDTSEQIVKILKKWYQQGGKNEKKKFKDLRW